MHKVQRIGTLYIYFTHETIKNNRIPEWTKGSYLQTLHGYDTMIPLICWVFKNATKNNDLFV